MWIDSHAHLAAVDDLRRLGDLVAAAGDNGVHRILNVATSLLSSNAVVRQCGLFPELSAAVGISPFDVTDVSCSAPRCELQDWQGRLAALASDPAVVAIGETGIDNTNPVYPAFELQRGFFEKHLELAIGRNLPVIVHSRGCEQQALDMCISSGIRTAVFHCYTGPLETLKRIIHAGYFVSFSGIITFADSSLAPCVSYAPLSNMLIETDSPYLAPVPHRGLRNQPAWVAYVGKAVASIKKIDEEECSRVLAQTYARVFACNQYQKDH
jgi:TatD DNase family protein